RPFLLTLRADLPSPFTPAPHPLKDEKEQPATDDRPGSPTPPLVRGVGATTDESPSTINHQPSTIAHPPTPIRIDLEGIADRVVAFPVPEGIYGQIAGIPGKALFTSYPVEGALPPSRPSG